MDAVLVLRWPVKGAEPRGRAEGRKKNALSNGGDRGWLESWIGDATTTERLNYSLSDTNWLLHRSGEITSGLTIPRFHRPVHHAAAACATSTRQSE